MTKIHTSTASATRLGWPLSCLLILLGALLVLGCDEEGDDDTSEADDDDTSEADDDDTTGGNAAPEFEPVDPVDLREGDDTDVTVVATDPDGDDVSLTHAGLPAFAAFEAGGGTGTLTLAPETGDIGVYDLTFIADDGLSTSDLEVIVTVEEAATVITYVGSPGGAGIGDGIGTDAYFYHPYGADWHDGLMYISDGNGSTIRVFDPESGEVTTLAGTPGESGHVDSDEGDALFAYPCGLEMGPDGMLYVADRENARIRVVDPLTGEVDTLEVLGGEFDAGDPFDLTFDAEGVLYVSDLDNCVIRRVNIDQGIGDIMLGVEGTCRITDGFPGQARIGKPRGILYDPDGYLWYADRHGHDIRRIDVATRQIVTLFGSPDGETGLVDGSGQDARFSYPTGVALDDGYLFVADSDNDSIRKIRLDVGNVSTVAGIGVNGNNDGPADQASFSWPIAVTVGPDGNLFVVDPGGHAIRHIDLADVDLTVSTVAGAVGNSGTADGVGTDVRMSEPRGLALGDGTDVWLIDTLNSEIRLLDAATAEVVTVAGSAESFEHLDGIGTDARFTNPSAGAWVDGKLFVVETAMHVVRTVDGATHEVVTVAGEPNNSGYLDGTGTDARFNRPRDIALAEDGMLYIADNSNHAVRRMDPETFEVTTLVAVDDPHNPFTDPEGIIASGDGLLYVTDYTGCTLVAVDMVTGETEVVAGDRDECVETDGVGELGKMRNPLGLDIDPATGLLYIASFGGRTVRQFDPDSGLLTTFTGDADVMAPVDGPVDEATYSTPTDVLVVDDDLLVLDRYCAHIRKVVLP